MTINVWMDVLCARLTNFFTDALEESEHFDFMTLLRRIYANKTLMNFHLMIEQAHDLATEENLTSGLFHQKVMREVLPRVTKALDSLSKQVSVEDMRHSSYVVRENAHYTFMEAYWVLVAWCAFGEDSIVPLDLFVTAVNELREAIAKGTLKPHQTAFVMVGMKKGEKLPSKPDFKNKWRPPEGAVDIVQLLLQRMDQKLLSIKEFNIRSHKTPDEVLVSVVH